MQNDVTKEEEEKLQAGVILRPPSRTRSPSLEPLAQPKSCRLQALAALASGSESSLVEGESKPSLPTSQSLQSLKNVVVDVDSMDSGFCQDPGRTKRPPAARNAGKAAPSCQAQETS